MSSKNPTGQFAVTQHPKTGEWFVGKYPTARPVGPPPVQRPAQRPTINQQSPQPVPSPSVRSVVSDPTRQNRPDVAEFRRAFQKEFGGPTQPQASQAAAQRPVQPTPNITASTNKGGITGAFRGVADAISANLKDQLWESHRLGKSTMAGVRDPILAEAARLGVSKTDRNEFDQFVNNKYRYPQTASAQPAPSKQASDLDRFNYKPTRPFDPNASQHHLEMLYPNHAAVTPEVMQEYDKIAAGWDNSNPAPTVRALEAIKAKIANTDPSSIQPSLPQQRSAQRATQPPAPDPFGNVNQELLGSPFRQLDAVPNAGDQLFKKGQRPAEPWWFDRQKELARQNQSQSQLPSPPIAQLPVQTSNPQVVQPQQPAAPQSSQQQNPAIASLREHETQLQQLIQRSVAQQKQFAQSHPGMAEFAEKAQKRALKELDEVHRQMGRMMSQEQRPTSLPQTSPPQDEPQPAAQSSPSLFDQSRQVPAVKPKNALLKTPYTPRAITDFKKALENMRIGRRGADAPPQESTVNPVDAGYDAFEAARLQSDSGNDDASFDTSFDTDVFDSAAAGDEKKKIDEPGASMPRTTQRTVQVGKNAFATAHFRDEDQADLHRLGMLQRKKGMSGKLEESQLLQRLKESTKESESVLRNRAQFIATHASEVFRDAKHGESMHIDEPRFSTESEMTPGKFQHATRQLKDFIKRENLDLLTNRELDHNDLPTVVDYASMEREMLKKQIDAAHAAKDVVFPDNWKDDYAKEKRKRELDVKKQKEARAIELSQDQNLNNFERKQLLDAFNAQKDNELKDGLKKTMRHLLASMRGKRGHATKVFRGSDQDIDSLANPKSQNLLEGTKRNRAFVGMDEVAERLNPEVVDFLAGPTGESDIGDDMGRRYRALGRILNNDIPRLPALEEFFSAAIQRILDGKKQSDEPERVYTDPFSMMHAADIQRYSLVSQRRLQKDLVVAMNKFLQKSA